MVVDNDSNGYIVTKNLRSNLVNKAMNGVLVALNFFLDSGFVQKLIATKTEF